MSCRDEIIQTWAKTWYSSKLHHLLEATEAIRVLMDWTGSQFIKFENTQINMRESAPPPVDGIPGHNSIKFRLEISPTAPVFEAQGMN